MVKYVALDFLCGATLKNRVFSIVALISFCLISFPAIAATVFSQQPSLGQAVFSDFSGPGPFQQATSFSVSPGTQIKTVTVFGYYNGGGTPTDDFTLRFFDDASGAPAAIPTSEFAGVAATRTDTGQIGTGAQSGLTLFRWDFILPSAVPVLDSTTYWISAVNNTSSWLWADYASEVVQRHFRNFDGQTWTLSPGGVNDMAFELADTVDRIFRDGFEGSKASQ